MSNQLFNKIAEKWQTIIILVFMVVAIVFSVSIFIPARYSSQTKMIIIQNHQSEEVDAFSAAKSAEYLSDIIANIIFTESFIQDMLDAPFEVKKDFSNSSEKRMRIWEKTVDVDKENNTGILAVTVFDKSRNEAESIAESIAWGLSARGSKYHGGGDSIQIKTIDGPITSEKPATPNIWLNSLLALIIGIAGSISAIYFFNDFELVLLGKRTSSRRNDKNGSNKQIVASLEKIRENLKNQKPASLVMDDYSIENIDKRVEDLAEIEENLIAEDFVRDGELVEEIQEEDFQEEIEKGQAPQNLPIAEKPEDNGNKGFITMEELNLEAEKMGLTDNKKEADSKYEASSEEVKERLNKLLRGEL